MCYTCLKTEQLYFNELCCSASFQVPLGLPLNVLNLGIPVTSYNPPRNMCLNPTLTYLFTEIYVN